MMSQRAHGVLFAVAVLVAAGCAPASVSRADEGECPAKAVTVRGNSLSPLLESGADVMMKPAACAGPVRRGDLVIFRTGAREEPVVKIVRGLPGDRFEVDEGGFILVNGSELQNSAGERYRLSPARRGMLRAYSSGYGGVIPQDTYLLLGDGPKGALDSSRIGLVHVSDFVMIGQIPEMADGTP